VIAHNTAYGRGRQNIEPRKKVTRSVAASGAGKTNKHITHASPLISLQTKHKHPHPHRNRKQEDATTNSNKPTISKKLQAARDRAQKIRDRRTSTQEMAELTSLNFASMAIDLYGTTATDGEAHRRNQFQITVVDVIARLKSEEERQLANAAETARTAAQMQTNQENLLKEKLRRRFHAYFERSY
jgi:hypothetical protein